MTSDQEFLLRKPFSYEPLDLNTDTIRLVQLTGFDDDGRLSCTLKDVSRSQAQYLAVSYTWEPTGPTENAPAKEIINIDGKALEIHQNIHDFLFQVTQVLQDSDVLTDFSFSNRADLVRSMELIWPIHTGSQITRLFDSSLEDIVQTIDGLWIDAICLDQQNILKRNHQVRQMYEIYASAKSVIVWLGRARGTIEAWLSRFAILSYQQSIYGKMTRLSDAWDDPALYDLLNLRYWSRAWIVQELLAAQEVLLVYGHFAIHWSVFWYNSHITAGIANLNLTDAYRHYKPIGQVLQQLDFETALTQYEGLSCKDPKDSLYSLRAVIESADNFDIHYDESVHQLAIRAALYFGQSIHCFERVQKVLGIPPHKWDTVMAGSFGNRYYVPGFKPPMHELHFLPGSMDQISNSTTTQPTNGTSFGSKNEPTLKMARMTRKKRCPICRSNREVVWRAFNPKRFAFITVMCLASSREPIHFFGIWNHAIGGSEHGDQDVERNSTEQRRRVSDLSPKWLGPVRKRNDSEIFNWLVQNMSEDWYLASLLQDHSFQSDARGMDYQ